MPGELPLVRSNILCSKFERSQRSFHCSIGRKNIGRPVPRGSRKRIVFTTPTIWKSARFCVPPNPNRLPITSSLGKYLSANIWFTTATNGALGTSRSSNVRPRKMCAPMVSKKVPLTRSHDGETCGCGRSSSVTPDCQLLPDIGLYSTMATLRTFGIWRIWRSMSW